VAGLAVQFGRGVWVAAAAGLIISAAIFRGVAGILRVVTVGILVISLVVGAAAIFKPRMAEALLARAVGIGAEIESGGSYGWRKAENSAAMARLERSPLTGTGLGGDYKQTFSAEGSFKIETSYIHNAYLYFPLKMGLLATLIPLAFVVAFVVTIRQGQLRHRGPTADPALVAALCGAFAVPVITSYTQPEWVNPLGIAAFAVLMGLALLYRQMGTPLAVAGASPR
jgi:O-antigen ligase